MKKLPGLLKVIVATSFAAGLSTASLEAQLIPATGDLFSSTDTVTVSSALPGYNNPSLLVDQSASTGAFVFNDDGLPVPEGQSVSITGFNSAIDSLSFYDYYGGNNGASRDPNSVIIYYSSTAQTSLNPSDYTALNGGLAFNLPQVGTQTVTQTLNNGLTAEGVYVNSTSYSSGGTGPVTYDTLSGLDIPAGTQSILLTFDSVLSSSGTYYGGAFSEIQGFAPADVEVVPEPSAWAMLLLGLGVMVALRCFRRGTSVISEPA